MRQFAINMVDKRVVLCTKETLDNVDYHPISKKVVEAIKSGTITKDDVTKAIRGNIQANPVDWDELVKNKNPQNVRRSEITRNTTEASETAINQEDVKGEFDIGDAETEASEEPAKKKPGRKPKAETAEAETTAE